MSHMPGPAVWKAVVNGPMHMSRRHKDEQHLILLLTNFLRVTLLYFWSENGKAQSEVIFHIRVLYGHKNISYSKD